MDEITREFIASVLVANPNSVVHLTHQFLDGDEGKECGFIPVDWDGSEISIKGKWWEYADNGKH